MPTPHNVEPTIPSDMWQTLIRIETACVRSETKIDGLADKIDGAVKRLDNHEDRLGAVEKALGELSGQRAEQLKRFNNYCDKVDRLETWHSEIAGGTKGVTWAANLGKIMLGAAIGLASFLGIQAVTPHRQVAKSELSVERTVQLPTSH